MYSTKARESALKIVPVFAEPEQRSSLTIYMVNFSLRSSVCTDMSLGKHLTLVKNSPYISCDRLCCGFEFKPGLSIDVKHVVTSFCWYSVISPSNNRSFVHGVFRSSARVPVKRACYYCWSINPVLNGRIDSVNTLFYTRNAVLNGRIGTVDTLFYTRVRGLMDISALQIYCFIHVCGV